MAFERRILTRYDASTAGFDRGTRRVDQQLARLQRTTDTRLRAIDDRFARAGRAALRLGTALGAVTAGLGVNAVRRYAEAWRNAERQLTSAGAAVEGNREKLARLAIRVRGDFEATSSAAARFARVTGDGIDASIRRVETLQKLLAIGGASQGERRSAVLQLTQGLRSEQLGGEELRAIKEAAPIEFLDALAARAGGTRRELKELGAQGKLTSDVITGALDDLAATADQRFSELAVTGSEAAEILGTGFSVFFGRLDEQFGATAGINQFLSDTGRFLAEDAEAAATFAKALEVAAVAAGSLAGGRALGAVNRVLVEGGVARREAVQQSQSLVEQTRTEVQQARLLLAQRKREVAQTVASSSAIQNRDQATRQLTQARQALATAERNVTNARIAAGRAGAGRGAVEFAEKQVAVQRLAVQLSQDRVAAEKRVLSSQGRLTAGLESRAKVEARLRKAREGLTAAEARAAAATNAHAIAQGNLSAATRITTRAMNGLRTAFNFFGGVPGLIIASVSAAVLLTDAFEDQADRIEDLQGKLADVEAGIGRVRQAEQNLESDTEALKAANERLETAIANQADAAADTARLEIDAINRRIGKNRELKAEYEALIQAQIGVIQGQLSIERRQFQREFGGTGATFQRPVNTGASGGEFGTIAPSGAELATLQLDAIARKEEEINRKISERQTLSEEELKFLETRRDLKQLEIDLETQLQNLEGVRNQPEVTTPTGGAEGLGDGGATKEQTDALQELIAASDQRAFQLLDEIQLTRAAADEVAFLEEKQRLLAFAKENDIALNQRIAGTNETVLDLINALARSYADTSDKLDKVRAARELITQVTEAELTVTEKIARANERLDALLPALIELLGDEAEAYRVLAAAKAEAAAKIREAEEDPSIKRLADDLGTAISQADSLSEALENVLQKLAEIALQAAFQSAFTGGQAPTGSNPFAGIFNSIFASVFHGGGVVGRTAAPQRALPAAAWANAPRMHDGGIAGLGANEVPAILERGEIVVPKNVGTGRGGGSLTIHQGDLNITQPGASMEQIRRAMAEQQRDTLAKVQQLWVSDPDAFPQS